MIRRFGRFRRRGGRKERQEAPAPETSSSLRFVGAFLLMAGCGVLLASSRLLKLQARGQEGGPAPLRVSTRLVQVNVVVTRHNGQPVPGLTADDFEIWDTGHKQKISSFSVQSSEAVAKATAALPPGTYTNRIEQQAGAPASVTVILLDGLNTHFEDQTYAKKRLIRFLDQIQPDDHVGLYTLGSGLRVLHDFTADSSSLLTALKDYAKRKSLEAKGSERGQPGATAAAPYAANPSKASPDARIEMGLDDYLQQTEQPSADWYSMDRTLTTLDAVTAIARRLSQIPGRKNLVWVASSFPFTIGAGTANAQNVTRGQRSFGPEIERTERALNNANVAIYPVDARGLVGKSEANPNVSAAQSGASHVPSPFRSRMEAESPTITGLGQLTPTHDTMDVLADETGGRAFYGSSDIMGSIRRVFEDSRLTYTLGYYPSDSNWDGKFHEIKVKVRKSGANVLYRKGYLALAEKPLDAEDQRAAMMKTAGEPLDATAIGLTVHESPRPQPAVLPLTVNIETQGVVFSQQSGRWVASLNLLFAQMGPGGQMVKGLTQPVRMHLTDDEYHQLLEKGLSISGKLGISSSAEKLRVIVLDDASGAEGSVTVPLAAVNVPVKTGKLEINK
jgi:VWFA-related protein